MNRQADKATDVRPFWAMKGAWPFLCAIAGILFVTGCGSKHYQKAADKEVYGIIHKKSGAVTNMESNFTIETNLMVKLDDLSVKQKAEEYLGESDPEVGSKVLPLSRALEIAFKNSRQYQNRKETLYLSALDLTLARHKFTPIFSSGASTRYEGSKVKDGMDQITEQHDVKTSGNVGMDVALRSGAKIATDISLDFTRFMMGGGVQSAGQSHLAASLSQPLLRGAGYKVTMENLTQSERNLLYALRDFVQFRRDYAIQIAQSYYNVLRNRDAAINSWDSFKAFKRLATRQREFVKLGRQRQSELGRLAQEELDKETIWVTSVNSYKSSLDTFKVLLGFSSESHIMLDGTELSKLAIVHPTVAPTDAIRVALASRVDLYSQRDRYEDASRKVDLAKNGLLPDLDLVIQSSADSQPGTGLPKLDYSRVSWNAGFDVKLPLDRKAERNTLRTSQINYQRALRDLEQKVDDIKLQVLEDCRNLELNKRNYESYVQGVDLGKLRVDEQDMLAELGRNTAEEVVNAQNAYISTLNQKTQALISHTMARLSLWRDLGILQINENGQWAEITNITK